MGPLILDLTQNGPMENLLEPDDLIGDLSL